MLGHDSHWPGSTVSSHASSAFRLVSAYLRAAAVGAGGNGFVSDAFVGLVDEVGKSFLFVRHK